jgi:3-phosphoshikimate 1-carboxyvinyltransferase
LRLSLPGDISSAAFLIVSALITPASRIVLTDVLLNPGRTGLIDALQAMGAKIEVRVREERGAEPVGDITATTSQLRGTVIDGPLVVRMIDEFPAFAVAAAFATGDTVVRGAAELRHKESDRISALSKELRKLGAQVDESPDGFCILGQGGLQGGQTVDPSGDHRLAMALAVAGLASSQPVQVQEAQIIAESFPDFAGCFRSLGAAVTAEA